MSFPHLCYIFRFFFLNLKKIRRSIVCKITPLDRKIFIFKSFYFLNSLLTKFYLFNYFMNILCSRFSAQLIAFSAQLIFILYISTLIVFMMSCFVLVIGISVLIIIIRFWRECLVVFLGIYLFYRIVFVALVLLQTSIWLIFIWKSFIAVW